jgi:EAL domain-containing protein (putative c-di-GMP-specific phosphodiesterase class I)/GGDEF domain-containing protein
VIETLARAKYREAFPVEMIAARVKFTQDIQQFYLVNDLSDRKKVEASIHRSHYVDAQTLLPNRHMFLIRLEENLRQWRQDPNVASFSVALLEIDRVNMAGEISSQHIDSVIHKVIMRIQHVIDEYPGLGKLSRMTYDEFAFIIPGHASSEKLIHIASRIRKVAAIPVIVDAKTIFPNIYLGILAKAQQHVNVSDILTRVNFLLEQAKQKSNNGFVLFQRDDENLSEHQDAQVLEHEIQKALDHDEIFAFFQPIVALETSRLVGFESLVRWISSDTKHRPPEYFIGLAEESGSITAVDRRVIEKSIAALAMWNKMMPELYIAVNVSIRDLVESSFVDFIIDTLHEHDANAANLVLEFTENLLIVETEALNSALNRLKESGVRIGLDDFGRRYSSLEYINQLPLSYLKIGHAFVSKITKSVKDDRIVDIIIQLTNSLTIGFIAEGIETEEQLKWLQAKGCRFGQGFYFSEAVSRIEANKYVKRNSESRRAN